MLFGYGLLHGLQQSGMNISGARDDPIIFTKRSSQSKIEWLSARVCDDAPGFLHNELAGSVVLTQYVRRRTV
jgi:hypothetical protein